MSLIIEDGSGVIGANSYGSVAGFKQYFGNRQGDISALSTSTIEKLLVSATDYIDTRWGSKFKGCREFRQGLHSRGVITLNAAPLNNETVTLGSVVYTFKTTPDIDINTEVGISTSLLTSLESLAAAFLASSNEDFISVMFVDPDIASMTIYVDANGVTTTNTLTNGSFSGLLTTGQSGKRQPLEFPRENLYDRAGEKVCGIPEELLEATYEYAFRANTAALAPDPTVDASGLRVTGQRTKVGPIETETRFAEETNMNITRPYPAADRLLSEFILQGGAIRA